MTIEIVEFPSYKMVDLSIVMLNYQRVYILNVSSHYNYSHYSIYIYNVCIWLCVIRNIVLYDFIWLYMVICVFLKKIGLYMVI